jgi:serine/threonine protein kinase
MGDFGSLRTDQTRPCSERCYEIVGPLHQGGMGELFLADLKGLRGFRRRVVLKTLLPHYEADPALRRLFFREARLMACLHHPNIVQVFDLPVVDGRTYIAMEHVQGRSFHQTLKRARYDDSRLPLRIALRVVGDVLRGLHAAHTAQDRQGRPLRLIHRDVSPGNILVSFDGEVKLVDFGIAKFRDAPDETRPQSIRGKARYVSPEQIRGRPASFCSDIYSAGVVLADALLGRPLWHRASINETLLAIATEERERTLARITRARRVPDALQVILRQALAIEPGTRPHSALEMAEQLDEVGRELGAPVSDSELGLWVRTAFREDADTPDPAHLLPERATHLSLVTPVGPIMRDTLVDGSVKQRRVPVSLPPHPVESGLADPGPEASRPVPWDPVRRNGPASAGDRATGAQGAEGFSFHLPRRVAERYQPRRPNDLRGRTERGNHGNLHSHGESLGHGERPSSRDRSRGEAPARSERRGPSERPNRTEAPGHAECQIPRDRSRGEAPARSERRGPSERPNRTEAPGHAAPRKPNGPQGPNKRRRSDDPSGPGDPWPHLRRPDPDLAPTPSRPGPFDTAGGTGSAPVRTRAHGPGSRRTSRAHRWTRTADGRAHSAASQKLQTRQHGPTTQGLRPSSRAPDAASAPPAAACALGARAPVTPAAASPTGLWNVAEPAFLLGLAFGSALTLCTSLLVLLAE